MKISFDTDTFDKLIRECDKYRMSPAALVAKWTEEKLKNVTEEGAANDRNEKYRK